MRSTAAFNPRNLDIGLCVEKAVHSSGVMDGDSFERLKAVAWSASAPAAVQWSAQFSRLPLRGGMSKPQLRLSVNTCVLLECQRCLEAVEHRATIERHFLFASDEAQAALWDEQTDDDVLVVDRHFDLTELIEDELLLDLPLVPRHEVCPQPLLMPHAAEAAAESSTAVVSEPDGVEAPPHPFAALAKLKLPL